MRMLTEPTARCAIACSTRTSAPLAWRGASAGSRGCSCRIGPERHRAAPARAFAGSRAGEPPSQISARWRPSRNTWRARRRLHRAGARPWRRQRLSIAPSTMPRAASAGARPSPTASWPSAWGRRAQRAPSARRWGATPPAHHPLPPRARQRPQDRRLQRARRCLTKTRLLALEGVHLDKGTPLLPGLLPAAIRAEACPAAATASRSPRPAASRLPHRASARRASEAERPSATCAARSSGSACCRSIRSTCWRARTTCRCSRGSGSYQRHTSTRSPRRPQARAVRVLGARGLAAAGRAAAAVALAHGARRARRGHTAAIARSAASAAD